MQTIEYNSDEPANYTGIKRKNKELNDEELHEVKRLKSEIDIQQNRILELERENERLKQELKIEKEKTKCWEYMYTLLKQKK